MKIIEVPYSKNIQSVIDSVIMALAMSGIAFVILSIIKLDWKVFLIGSLIAIPSSIYTWKIMTMQILIWTKDFITIKVIADINSNGFTINTYKKSLKLRWDEIKSLRLVDNNDLLIELNKGNPIKIDKEYNRWYYLLQNIPKTKLKNSQIPDYLEHTFKELSTCMICGSIALKKGICLACKAPIFNNEIKKEFANEIEYLKAEQLELFCTENEFEKVNFYLEEDDGFLLDKNWSPIVTEKEIILYSKENVWN